MAKIADKMILFTYFINDKCIEIKKRKTLNPSMNEVSSIKEEIRLWQVLYRGVCSEVLQNIQHSDDKYTFYNSVVNSIPRWLNRVAASSEKESFEQSIQDINTLTQPSVDILTAFINVITADTIQSFDSAKITLSIKNLLCKKTLGLMFVYWKTKSFHEISHLSTRVDNLFAEFYAKHTVKIIGQIHTYNQHEYVSTYVETYLFNLLECSKNSAEVDTMLALLRKINEDITQDKELEEVKLTEEKKLSSGTLRLLTIAIDPNDVKTLQSNTSKPKVVIQSGNMSITSKPATLPVTVQFSDKEIWTAVLKQKYTQVQLVALCEKHKVSHGTSYVKDKLCAALIAKFGNEVIKLTL